MVQSAIRLLFSGELMIGAISEATKAVIRYNASVGAEGSRIKKPPGSRRNKAQSKSSRAGLQFSVSRIGNFLKYYLGGEHRQSTTANVYLAAVLEYLTAELLEAAGKQTKMAKKKRIDQRHLLLAVNGDEELDKLLAKPNTVLGGGVTPYIHKFLIEH